MAVQTAPRKSSRAYRKINAIRFPPRDDPGTCVPARASVCDHSNAKSPCGDSKPILRFRLGIAGFAISGQAPVGFAMMRCDGSAWLTTCFNRLKLLFKQPGSVEILAILHPHPIPLPKRERANCPSPLRGECRKSSRAYRKFDAIRFPPRDDPGTHLHSLALAFPPGQVCVTAWSQTPRHLRGASVRSRQGKCLRG